MSTEQSITQRAGNWMSRSVTLKLIVIIILTLLLLIPSTMIKSIIGERQMLRSATINEVSAMWAKQQTIRGPVLTIPLVYTEEHDNIITYRTEYWHVLPHDLSFDGTVDPQTLRRGIYEVAVYTSEIGIQGTMKLEEKVDRNNLYQIQYDNAFLTIGVTDLRGIKDNISFHWGDEVLDVHPGSKISALVPSGFTVDLPDISHLKDSAQTFSFALNLNGSQNLSFVPLGNTTKVRLTSPWSSPGFNGNFLPDHREVSDTGFLATWKVLQLNRNFPQSWTGSAYGADMSKSAFGVDLILPLDDYQKSSRSIKYGIMTIALTFLVFFLVEILNKRRIHPFQYVLVGLALCLFYVLLVSISEHSNFNIAYGISFIGILTMITLYSAKIFRAKKLSLVLAVCLTGIYGFVFVTLQLKDYALLMGSVGLALILAATMYLTRNIDWYGLKIGEVGKAGGSEEMRK
jgi:inner membrane protein